VSTATGVRTYTSLVRGLVGGLNLARKIMSDRGMFALLSKELARGHITADYRSIARYLIPAGALHAGF
jgi:hypothetical protein